MKLSANPGADGESTAGQPGLSIAIVGAGIGGLSLATTLLSHGFRDVRVFERGRELSSRGGTVRLDESAQQALSTMGVGRAVDEVAIPMEGFDRLSNGRHLNRYTPNLISISREALQRILADSVPREVVLLGRAVTGVGTSDRVELSFADGSTEAFDLVIGADGVNSVVAAQCFPTETAPRFAGYVVYYCVAKGSFAPELVYSEHFFSKGSLGFRMVTVAGGGSDGRWDSLQITTRGPACSSEWDARGEASEMMSYLDIAGDRCLPGAREIVANADRVFKWGMYQRPAMNSWVAGDGRIVLLGDAAHAMAPFTGQGASTAIVDGLCLGDLLATRPLPAALEEYENARKPICEDAIRNAHRRGMRITAHGVSRWYTDLVMRLMVWCSRQEVLRRVVPAQTFKLDTGADVLERVDRVVDIFRFEQRGPGPARNR